MGALDTKVLIVTGALGAIGSVAARVLAEAGAKVLATDMMADGADLTGPITGAGGTILYHQADLTDEDQVRALVDRCVARFGRLDGAFNNAGIEQSRKALPEITGEEWSRIMRVNVESMFYCLKYQFLAMTDGGAIVNNSSAVGAVGSAQLAAYSASKHAVCGLTRCAAVDGGPLGIRVNAVLPGSIRTPMHERVYGRPEMAEARKERLKSHPIGRFGEVDEIGKTVRWLLSDDASFVTGGLYAVDGGFTAI